VPNERQNSEKVEWLQHPQTKKLVKALEAARLEAMEAWANKEFIGSTMEETNARNAAALGGVGMVDQILDAVLDTTPEAP
jgi:hypothetical protein